MNLDLNIFESSNATRFPIGSGGPFSPVFSTVFDVGVTSSGGYESSGNFDTNKFSSNGVTRYTATVAEGIYDETYDETYQ